jgi:hypothetical protein
MSASWRTGDLTVLGIAAIGTVVLTAASFLVAPDASVPRQDGSSFAVHRDGAKAAYLLLRELGYRVDRSYEPLAALDADPKSTALVLANPLERPSEQDVRALKTFLNKGGVVLATGPLAAPFLPGVPSVRLKQGRAPKQMASLPGPLSAGVTSVEIAPSAPLPLDSPFVPIFGSAREPAVLSASFGQGRAIWWAGSTPLVNGGLGQPGHAELLVNALGPATRLVLWDEFYHGHTRSFWSYVSATPLPIALLQLGGIATLAGVTYARRRRPIRARAVEARTSPLELIDTMGGLYERAGAANAAVATVFTRTRRRLASAAGLPPSTDDDRLVAVCAERLSLDAAELERLLSNARVASTDPNLTGSQAVAIARDLQDLAARVITQRRES